MLTFIYHNDADLIKDILNGQVQQSVYDYLKKLIEDTDFFRTSEYVNVDEQLTDENVYEYFEAQFDDFFIDWKEIKTPCRVEAHIIHNMIESVFKRVDMEVMRVPITYIDDDMWYCPVCGNEIGSHWLINAPENSLEEWDHCDCCGIQFNLEKWGDLIDNMNNFIFDEIHRAKYYSTLSKQLTDSIINGLKNKIDSKELSGNLEKIIRGYIQDDGIELSEIVKIISGVKEEY